jgi:hypothetical protein
MNVLAANLRRAAHGKHVCGHCRQRIDASDRYLDLRIADGGTAWTFRTHVECDAMFNRYGRHFGLDDGDPVDWKDVVEWNAER